jgi:response regulator RpfG family c-di-GMP phosphodiesterase
MVIVADRHARTRRLCRKILEREGYRVVEATDVQELISCASYHQPDLIIMDAFSDGSDGLDAARRLRSLPATKHVPILMLVSRGDPWQGEATGDTNVDEYLVKPIRPTELALRVKDIAGRKTGSAELQRCHELLGEHARVLDLLLDFSAALANSDQLDHLLTRTLEVTTALLCCRRALILLPDPERKTLKIAKSIGIDDPTPAELTVPIGEGVAGRVYESGGRIILDSADQADCDGEFHDSRLYSNPPVVSMAMRASEHAVGVLYVAERVGGHRFTECELDYLELISESAAAAIQGILTHRAREHAREAIAIALASLAEHRDNDTGRHLDRMAGFCVILANQLAVDSEYASQIDSGFIDNLRRAAPLHDIGKVAVPDHILLKPGKLMPDEMKIMQTHATVGAETVRSARAHSPDSQFLITAEEIAHGHHEWFDGNGYPRGIRGSQIPLSARVAAIADVYDALVTRRVYKDAMSHAEARSVIKSLSSRQFDPVIVEAFLSTEAEFRKLAAELRDELEAEGTPAGCVDGLSRSGPATTDAEPTTITFRDQEDIVLTGRTST